MFIDKHSISDIVLALEKLISGQTNYEKTKKALKQLSQAYELNYDDLIGLYNKMSLFRMDVQRVGGEEAYLNSDILWLQSELELLLECYRIFQESGASVALISNSLSKDHLNVFPKTKSQLQNTYYKLRNGQISLETTRKQKPGRKRIQEMCIPFGVEKEEAPKKLEEVQSQQENAVAGHKKNLVQLLSGMINNFQVICDHNTESEKKLYQLIEGIYELSTMSAERINIHQDVEGLKTELSMLRAENEKLKQEKEELLEDIRNMTEGINSFIKSSDMDQLRGLSHFISTCKQELNKLGLYNGTNERNLKIVVDGSGQVLSISE